MNLINHCDHFMNKIHIIDKNYYVQCFHLSLFQENLIDMQYSFVTKQYKIIFVFCRMGLCLELIHELQRTLLWQTKTAAKFTIFLIIYSEWNEFECINTCSVTEKCIFYLIRIYLKKSYYHYLKYKACTVKCFY